MRKIRAGNSILKQHPVRDHPLNYGLNFWLLHLPGEERGHRTRDLTGGVTVDAAATAAPTGGRGAPPPGRWGSQSYLNSATTDRVNVASGYSNLISAQAVHTISLWVYPRSFANSPVFLSHGTTGTTFFMEFTTTGYVYWGYDTTFRTYTSGQCAINQWWHLVFSRTGTGNSGNLFVNGVLASTYTGTFGNTEARAADLWIGNYNGAGLGLNGLIDDVRIYSTRALDVEEANALFKEGLAGYPSLLNRTTRKPYFLSTGQTVSVGLVTETDSPLAVTSRKALAFGLTSETDTALAMTARKSLAAGLASETDSPLAMASAKSLAFGLVSETDAALGISFSGYTIAVGLASEADSPLALASLKALAFGLVSEADSPLAMSAVRTYPVGLTTETDAPLAMTSLKALSAGLVTETDAALPMTSLVGGQLGLVTETDSPLALSVLKTLAVGLTTETDTPLAMAGLKARAFGLVTETDSALAMAFTKALAVGLVTETDTALAVTSLKALAFGLVTETDSALAVTLAGDVIAVGLVTETDTALAVSAIKYRSVGLVTETDTALGITVVGLTVAGPYSVATVQVFVPGPEASQVFTAGPAVMEVTE